MPDWSAKCQNWERRYGCSTFRPASVEVLAAASSALGMLPGDLYGLYEQSNGLEAESFRVFPLEDPGDIKRTWDGIGRANDPEKTRFLSRDRDLLRRFVVFAEFGGGSFASIDRADGSIWYEEGGQLHQTDLSLADFVEMSLREVAKL